jgi:hypothetical protein
VPRKRKYSISSPGDLREFVTSYDEPTGKFDQRGRPLTRNLHVVIKRDDPQRALDELARQLRSRESLSDALRDWLAHAIEHRAEFRSLDHALGLHSTDKRKPLTRDELKLGVLLFELRVLHKPRFSLNEILTVLGEQTRDTSSLREFYARALPELTKDGFALKVPGDSTIPTTEWNQFYSNYEQAIKNVVASRPKSKPRTGRQRE